MTTKEEIIFNIEMLNVNVKIKSLMQEKLKDIVAPVMRKEVEAKLTALDRDISEIAQKLDKLKSTL